MSITKVALAGATGNIGPTVLRELVSAGFEVTVLSRSSNHKIDARVRIVEVDYNSVESLTNALSDHDALVIALGQTGLGPHLNLVNAAVAANVKRIIPSEFGSDTTNPRAAALPVSADKVAVQAHLKKLAAANDTSYTLVICGPLFDLGLQVKFLLDLTSSTPELYDGGDRRFSTTTLAGVGKAVTGVLKNPDATRNKAVFIQSADVSQRELLGIAARQVSPREVSTVELEKAAFAELQNPSPNGLVVAFNFLRRIIFGEGFGSHFPVENLSNDLLGVPKLTEVEIKDIISRYS